MSSNKGDRIWIIFTLVEWRMQNFQQLPIPIRAEIYMREQVESNNTVLFWWYLKKLFSKNSKQNAL